MKRYQDGTTILRGAPSGASSLLDHDLAAPSWTDTFKMLGLLVAGMLGMGALFGDPIPGMGAMGDTIENNILDAQERRRTMRKAGVKEVF